MAFEATTAVMDTAELREMILLQMDNKTLLLSQRVCKNFKATIESSNDIQRKLFFQVADKVPSLRDRMRMRPDEYVNPLFTSSRSEFNAGKASAINFQCGDRMYGITLVTSDPFYRAQQRAFIVNVECVVEILASGEPGRQADGCESWRRMHLYAPGFEGNRWVARGAKGFKTRSEIKERRVDRGPTCESVPVEGQPTKLLDEIMEAASQPQYLPALLHMGQSA